MKKKYPILALMGILAALLLMLAPGYTLPAAARGPGVQGPNIGTPVVPTEFNGDLRSLPRVQSQQTSPHLIPRPGSSTGNGSVDIEDPAIQTEPANSQMPSPSANFAGLSFNASCTGGPCGSGWPPDPNGDVGLTDYVQAVNTAIGVFNKATGTIRAAVTLDSLWSAANSGTLCDNYNQGDPVVVYDAGADRWIVSDFAFTVYYQGPYYQCIAVSKTGDPVSGGWWFYPIQTSPTDMNDYPKLGVWADAYYLSANLFTNGATPAGVGVWALDRQQMLNGQTMTPVNFEVGTQYGTLLPSNLRGAAPPAGSPNYFLSIDSPSTDVLHLWRFHYDATTPANSWFGTSGSNSNPIDLTVDAFTEPCAAATNFNCIPQKGTTQRLDSLGDRLMMQLQYRYINGVESLWATHSVANSSGLDSVTGIRWYEIRDPNGTPSVYQQSTFKPDTDFRWMPSLAVDNWGNMAVGYSVASSTMYPSIRYTGRLATDPLNQLTQGEQTLFNGTGAQISYNRWGDYSGMTIDPADACTFWYTNEYYAATGIDWQTRIGAFRFTDCQAGPTPQALDDRDIRVKYDGWQGVADANASGGTYQLTDFVNNQATFTFTGTSVKWWCMKGPDGGTAKVLLDGVNKGTVNLYAATSSSAVCKQFTNLAYRSHKLTVVVLNGKVSIDAMQAGAVKYQETNRLVQYNTWFINLNTLASSGSFHYSGTANDTAEIQFEGTGITWLMVKGPNYGQAQVFIDNNDIGVVDLYAPTLQFKVPQPYPGLTPGTHTLTIRVLHTKAAASRNYWVSVDGFEITP